MSLCVCLHLVTMTYKISSWNYFRKRHLGQIKITGDITETSGGKDRKMIASSTHHEQLDVDKQLVKISSST